MFFSDEQLNDATVVADLKRTNGETLRAVQTPHGFIVFKKPSREVWDRWQDKNLVSKANASADARELCQACLVAECKHEDLVLAIDDKPGLLQGEFMGAIGEMAGWAEKFEVKKL